MKKIKLLTIGLFCWISSFGQLTAVPNSAPVCYGDVYDVVTYWSYIMGGSPTNCLSSLTSVANSYMSDLFDTSYNNDSYSCPGGLNRFRNFGNNGLGLPTVTTASITDITESSASGGGNVTSDGGLTVTERGICWNTSPNPTTANWSYVAGGTGTGSFNCPLPGLSTGTTYYVRAYATNSMGTAYGSNVSFTATCSLPVGLNSYVVFRTIQCTGESAYDIGSSYNDIVAGVYRVLSEGCNTITPTMKAASLTVGERVYWADYPCLVPSDGWYAVWPTDWCGVIFEISGGYIVSVTTCPC